MATTICQFTLVFFLTHVFKVETNNKFLTKERVRVHLATIPVRGNLGDGSLNRRCACTTILVFFVRMFCRVQQLRTEVLLSWHLNPARYVQLLDCIRTSVVSIEDTTK